MSAESLMSAHVETVHSIMLALVQRELCIHNFSWNKKQVPVVIQNSKGAKFWLSYIDVINRLCK